MSRGYSPLPIVLSSTRFNIPKEEDTPNLPRLAVIARIQPRETRETAIHISLHRSRKPFARQLTAPLADQF